MLLKKYATSSRTAAAVSALAIALASFSGALLASAETFAHADMKFFTVVDQTVGSLYHEVVTIQNNGTVNLEAGTLEIKFPWQIALDSANPAQNTYAGNAATWAVPALAIDGTYRVDIWVKPVAEGNFLISEASYFVNGTRVGFMAAPAVSSAGGTISGTVDTGATAQASALPATGMPADMTYFVVAMIGVSWGLLKKRFSL